MHGTRKNKYKESDRKLVQEHQKEISFTTTSEGWKI